MTAERAGQGTQPFEILRVRHELRQRTLRVAQVEQPGPQWRRIRFESPELKDFVSLGFDDHVKLLFAAPHGGEDLRRDYTPRDFDAQAGWLSIDFALHGHGPASQWAAAAQVGDVLRMGGPRGSMVLPPGLGWQLLVGDMTALPAIGRRLRELGHSTPVHVIALVPQATDRLDLPLQPGQTLCWVSSTEELLQALRAWQALQAGGPPGYAWCAGEAQSMVRVRQLLVEELGLDRRQVRAAAYWKQGASGQGQQLIDEEPTA